MVTIPPITLLDIMIPVLLPSGQGIGYLPAVIAVHRKFDLPTYGGLEEGKRRDTGARH